MLTSPDYPNLTGILCRWTLEFTDKYSDRMRIRFIDFDLADSDKCENEYLEITEQNVSTGNKHLNVLILHALLISFLKYNSTLN